jgi:hypothetical protein
VKVLTRLWHRFYPCLAEDIVRAPQSVRPLDAKLAKRMDALSKGVVVSPNEDLGPQTIL